MTGIRRLVAVGSLLGLVLTGQALPASAGTTPSPVDVGTFNINADMPFKRWKRKVRTFLPHVDVAGLQEVNSREKTSFLEGLGAWGSFRPAKLQQNPVLWRRDVFERRAARGVKIAMARHVGHEKPGTPSWRKASWATVVRLEHRETGLTVSIVNVHLVAGATQDGRPYPDRPRLVDLYRDQVRGMNRVVKVEKGWAEGRVWVIGDFNVNYPADKRWQVRGFPYVRLHDGRGLRSAWEAREEIVPGRGSGSRGGSYIDNIWAKAGARKVDVLRGIKGSDHYPVVARYRLG